MKNRLRPIVKTAFNKLPISIIELLVTQNKFKGDTFRSYLSPGKELIITVNNKFLNKTKFRIDKIFPIEQNIIEYGFYDYTTLTLFEKILDADDVCLDIGANIGSITFALANFVSPHGRVYAIEPGPEPFDRLKYNLELNKNLEQIISLHKIGLSDKMEKKYWKEMFSRGNAGFNDKEGIEMELSTLDDFEITHNIQKIDLIKIDVEGMELEIIKGSQETLKKHKPCVYYESWVNGFPEWEKKQKPIEDIFRSIDYKLFSYNLIENSLNEVEYPLLDQNTLAVPVSKIEQLIKKINK